MSIIKHITHYLTEAGKQALPAWLERLNQAALRTDGFDGIFLGCEPAKPDCTHLILQFDNESGFKNWQDNPIHTQLLRDLAPYLARPSEIICMTFDQHWDTSSYN